MVCLGLELGVAGWKTQTNPLIYGGKFESILGKHILKMFSLTTYCSYYRF